MALRLPLSTLLSQALVAFTIELDNEFEHQTPHRTTRHGSKGGPWLASMAMWFNCMRFAGEDGVTVRELRRLARTDTNLDGMRRWGYVFLEPGSGGKPSKKPGLDWVLRPTEKGRMAQGVWRELVGTGEGRGAIEKRWEERFGKSQIDRLRKSLGAIVSEIELDLPDCLPILGHGLFSKDREFENPTEPKDRVESLPLPSLLSRVLLAFAIDFERVSPLSLAICANVMRVLGDEGVRVRDLPMLSGVSKEAIAVATGYLQKRGMVAMEQDPAVSRSKLIRLTPQGLIAQEAYRELASGIEKHWLARFGKEEIGELRRALEPLVGDGTPKGSPLFLGLEPYPEGWRASVAKPATLPHYPMVLHRGGYPDGS